MASLATRVKSPGRQPAPDNLRFRAATPADLGLLRRWHADPEVKGALVDSDWGWAKELQRHPPWREWLIAEVDGRPIGFVQIIDPQHEETQYWGCMDAGYRCLDIWIGEPDARNRGYGARMMKLAIERAFAASDVHTILIDPLESNVRAHRFYERLGFEYVVCRRFGDDVCYVYKLKRQ